MKELAALIRKGLETGVQEDKLSWGIADDGTGPSANVNGLALIGKVGLERAQEMFEAAFAEIGDDDGPMTSQIAKELCIELEQCESLASAHFQLTAAEIAEALDNGSFQWEPA